MDVQLSLEKSRAGSIFRRSLSGLGAGVLLVTLALALAGCGGTTGEEGVATTTNSVSMAQKYTVDGVVDFSAFTTVNSQPVTLNDETGTRVPLQPDILLRWVMDNDDRNLYIALEWLDLTRNNGYDLGSGSTDYDGIRVMFDVDGNGTFAEGEGMHTLIAASIGSLYTDQHKVASGDATDLIGDGVGKLSYNAATQKYQAELMLPMRQDAEGQDGALTAATKFNFVIYDHVTSPTIGNAGYLSADTSNTDAWRTISLKSEVGFSHRAIPGGLTGLVTFVGSQDAPVGEVYTYDPASGFVMQVTSHANIYKDKVALSHDRTRIAFEGVLCDFAGSETVDECKQRSDDYEIYRVDVDGRNFTQLTYNATRDGHPGWSADDQSLVFTSFRNAGKGAVVIMDADGVETDNLTGVVGDDDRDPDFLADGRIVFATNRFTLDHQTRIAVMNGDGSGAVPLTSTDAVSDQAPVADATKAVFERFTKGTDPATDVESLFAPWNLIEVKLTGGAISTLLSDGWVNRQPVFDPTGRYVAYLKNTGYVAIHLMGRDGTQYGRLVPNFTSIRSLDWK